MMIISEIDDYVNNQLIPVGIDQANEDIKNAKKAEEDRKKEERKKANEEKKERKIFKEN